jgi:hypothetical protein
MRTQMISVAHSPGTPAVHHEQKLALISAASQTRGIGRRTFGRRKPRPAEHLAICAAPLAGCWAAFSDGPAITSKWISVHGPRLSTLCAKVRSPSVM